MRRLGYNSDTVVFSVYHISKREDFNYLVNDFIDSHKLYRHLHWRIKSLISHYYAFAQALKNYDIFNFYFNGGLLRWTPLKYYESFS